MITVEEAQYSSKDMNDNAMVDLVLGITHVHLKQTKFDTSQNALKNR